ncbi:DUF2911 domain-containing protein [Myroides sp. LJL116]
MIRNMMLFGIFLLSIVSQAQVLTPQTSPKAKVEQIVGLTQVNVEYSRPNVKDRLVFGDLVSYGKLWRTGANNNTVITFADDVEIQGKTLEKGSYALYSIPKVTQWEIIFYKDISNWGLPEVWDQDKVALSVNVKVENTQRKQESFTIGINELSIDGASLELMWDYVVVSVPFKVPTNAIAMRSIEQTMEGPSVVDYYSAAEYYYATNQDPNVALLWIDKAIEKEQGQTPFYFLRLKSQLLSRLNLKQQAVEVATQALELAKQLNNADYIKLSQESIKLWSTEIGS